MLPGIDGFVLHQRCLACRAIKEALAVPRNKLAGTWHVFGNLQGQKYTKGGYIQIKPETKCPNAQGLTGAQVYWRQSRCGPRASAYCMKVRGIQVDRPGMNSTSASTTSSHRMNAQQYFTVWS
jgi:hypothetical protein